MDGYIQVDVIVKWAPRPKWTPTVVATRQGTPLNVVVVCLARIENGELQICVLCTFLKIIECTNIINDFDNVNMYN